PWRRTAPSQRLSFVLLLACGSLACLGGDSASAGLPSPATRGPAEAADNGAEMDDAAPTSASEPKEVTAEQLADAELERIDHIAQLHSDGAGDCAALARTLAEARAR